MTRAVRKGWIPDLPDHRDLAFAAVPESLAKLPTYVDLRPKMPAVYDQLQLGSCTANGIAGAVQYERRRQNLGPDFVPSRLFIYYNERAMEGTVGTDSGAMIRDGIKSVASQGVCPEMEWPYVISQFAVTPPSNCYGEAVRFRALSYLSVPQTVTQMKGCLAQGFPIIFGFTVYESFESDAVARTGNVPFPGYNEAVLGGHCMLCVGFLDNYQYFICRNSWGPAWGASGYCYLPYSYLTDAALASDFWTIRLESAA
jgi:C1A family cysteine protease